jgi:hypothetical protein
MTDSVTCSRCDRVATGDDELAGSWYVVAGAIVCPTCQTLDDRIAVQNERDDEDGPAICPGCGAARPRDEFWRGYFLTPEQIERTLIKPEDAARVTLICSDCEPRVLSGLEP